MDKVETASERYILLLYFIFRVLKEERGHQEWKVQKVWQDLQVFPEPMDYQVLKSI